MTGAMREANPADGENGMYPLWFGEVTGYPVSEHALDKLNSVSRGNDTGMSRCSRPDT